MQLEPKINTIDADLSSLKNALEALDEVLEQPDYDISEVSEYCDEIEELAIAIRAAVENK